MEQLFHAIKGLIINLIAYIFFMVLLGFGILSLVYKSFPPPLEKVQEGYQKMQAFVQAAPSLEQIQGMQKNMAALGDEKFLTKMVSEMGSANREVFEKQNQVIQELQSEVGALKSQVVSLRLEMAQLKSEMSQARRR